MPEVLEENVPGPRRERLVMAFPMGRLMTGEDARLAEELRTIADRCFDLSHERGPTAAGVESALVASSLYTLLAAWVNKRHALHGVASASAVALMGKTPESLERLLGMARHHCKLN